ncbi:MAG: GNAT family N-acetyltransferase [Acidimicrobiia bacterium]
MPDLDIRPATPDDTPAILELLKASLGESPLLKRKPELWAWKHTANPFGPSIVFLAWSGQRLAGVRAMMRWELHTPGGSLIRCVRAVDTATHPDFMRRGIFRRLTEEAIEVARAEDVHLVFNTPNPKSAAGYLTMGWSEVGWIGAQIRPHLGRSVRPDGEAPPALTSVLPTARAFEPVDYEGRPALGLRTIRSIEYQTWRFNGHPRVRYGTVGEHETTAVVRAGVRSGRTELVLADLLGEPDSRVIREVARRSRAAYVGGFFSKGSPERGAAIRAGLIPIPGLHTLHLVARPLTELDFDVFDIDSWDLAVSDLELL